MGRLPAAVAAACFLVAPALRAQAPVPAPLDLLRVSPDGRRLVRANGRAFFWLGDTAWELFHRLTLAEAEAYLEDRARKGFTVVQAVALAELDGLAAPNANGDLPLEGGDPARPNARYFAHVDAVVDAATARGLYVAMLPTWGDKWNKKWGAGPEVFTPENARTYGEFLGRRYRDRPVVWVLGGDRSPERPEHFAVTRALAAGLRAGDGGAHLMTYHPQGEQSSGQYFHADDWLAFDMFQSGHARRDIPNDTMVAADRARTPPKPVLDGEPRYEDHPVDWDPRRGWFDEADVRQAAYWAVLAGAAGHTYGDHNVWQMWQPGRAPVSSARTPWRVALGHPGAAQMGHLRRLFEAHDFLLLEPRQALLASPVDTGAGRQRAAAARDGSYAVAYTPLGAPLTVRLDALAGPRGGARSGARLGTRVRARWMDPRTGAYRAAGTVAARGVRTFDPPGGEGRGRDWVLVLDAAPPVTGAARRALAAPRAGP